MASRDRRSRLGDTRFVHLRPALSDFSQFLVTGGEIPEAPHKNAHAPPDSRRTPEIRLEPGQLTFHPLREIETLLRRFVQSQGNLLKGFGLPSCSILSNDLAYPALLLLKLDQHRLQLANRTLRNLGYFRCVVAPA